MFAPILVLFLMFSFVPAISQAQSAAPTFYSFDNNLLRFGNGSESSINSNGLLQQPFYKNGESWFQLTYGSNPMDTAIGVGGSGTGTWNTTGAVFGTQTGDYGLTNLSVDYSGFIQSAAVGSGAKGYGTVTSTGNITKVVSGITYALQLKTTYELGENSSFIKINTSFKNIGSTNLVNLRTWVGTRDDFVGGVDSTNKTRGTINTTSGFTAATAAGSRNPAIKISSGSEGVIFFSPSAVSNTSISSCCTFANAYGQNPSTSPLAITNDGSYSLFTPIAELAPDSSEDFNWYYAAGSTAALASVVNEVAQAAASWDDQAITNTAINGSSYADAVTASGTGTITYSVAVGYSLPPGLNLNSSTGAITGSPTTNGVYTFRISATSVSGNTSSTLTTADLVLMVGQAPVLVSGDIDNQVSLAQQYESTLEVSGYPDPEYSVVTGALPTGLSLDSSTGKISGIPTKTGTYEFAVRASNSFGEYTFDQLTIVVGAKPGDFSNLSPFELLKGQDFSTDLSVVSVPTPQYTIESGSLPPGLTLTENGIVQGKPTAAGAYTFKVQAQSWAGTTVSGSIRLDVLSPPVLVSNTLPSEVRKGQSVSFGFISEGFPAPTYKLSEGSLPEGLTLDEATGQISGSTSTLGSFSFGILATNKLGSVDAGNFTVLVADAPKLSPVSLPSVVKIGEAVTQSLEFEGYPMPVASIKSGTLPTGLKLSAAGVLSGTATATGDFSFTIAISNRLGVVTSSHKMTISKSPALVMPNSGALVVGTTFELVMEATGFPIPTVSATGNLPAGLKFDAESLTISGTPTQAGVFEVTFTAKNSLGETSKQNLKFDVKEATKIVKVVPKISLGGALGNPIAGAPIVIEVEGAKPGATFIVELHSSPIVLEEGVVTETGLIFSETAIPATLEPGWHRIELRTTGADDAAVVDAVYFEITSNGLLESLPQDFAPTAEEVAAALTDDAAFLAALGIDPASLVPQEVAQEQTENVVTVVAALTLVAGATAAAASAGSVSGGSAPARAPAAPATGGSANSSSSSTRSGGGGSGGSSGGKDGDDGSDDETPEAGYGNIEGDLDDFTDERSGWGDRLGIWKSSWMTAADHIYFKLSHLLAKFSPVAGKVANDGSYLTAMTGVFSVLPTLAAGILGVMAVSSSEPSIYTSASVVLITVIIALGTIDALAGFVGMLAVIVTSISYYGFADGGVGRYLLTLAMLGFGPIILSTAFRKIRRNKVENLSGIWERITDLAIIFFISYLATTSLVGAVSALSSAQVGISEHSQAIGLMVAGIATIRVLLEEVAAAGFTARLEHINPSEVDGPSKLQTWFSLFVKYAVLCYMLAPIVGSGWQLWVGAFVIFFPSFVGQFDLKLPTSKLVWQIIPSGLIALTIASLVAGWSGTLVEMLFGSFENFKDLSFVLSPIPVIAISLLAMFAAPSKRFYEKLGASKIIYVIGGIAIYFWTLDVSGFWAALGG
ncbi:MAG: hypothetical protein RIS55_421 [Actinomycetota bacterium]|jgi:hypothetical protein